jgi:hypothetical protein
MSSTVVISLHGYNQLIFMAILSYQRKPLICADIKQREIWEWRDHTPLGELLL